MKSLCQCIVVAKEQRAMGSGAAAAPAKNVHVVNISVYKATACTSNTSDITCGFEVKLLRAGHQHFQQVHRDSFPSNQSNAALSQHGKDGLHVFVAQGTQFVVNDRCVRSTLCYLFSLC